MCFGGVPLFGVQTVVSRPQVGHVEQLLEGVCQYGFGVNRVVNRYGFRRCAAAVFVADSFAGVGPVAVATDPDAVSIEK